MTAADVAFIRLSDDLLARVVQHLVAAYPNEGCGLLLGRDNSAGRSVIDVQPLANVRPADEQRNRFDIDSTALLAAEKAAADRGLAIVGFFHSHPDAEARPSDFDLRHAWPFYSYVITAVHQGAAGRTTSWVLDEAAGCFDEQPMDILPGSSI